MLAVPATRSELEGVARPLAVCSNRCRRSGGAMKIRGDECPEELYRPLVFLLAQGMSIRGLADFLQAALGVN
jgi:hypothetical protein